MASLNTLRTRGGVIVSIVIGLALMAFLLGDLMSSGGGMFSSRKMRVGSINGTNVDYIEFANEADRMSVIAQIMSGKESLSTEEVDQTRNMAWESFVTNFSYRPGFENLGIKVGSEEEIDMGSGVYISPVITGTFANPSTGVFDPVILKTFITNLDQDPSGRSLVMWEYLKDQMVNQREMTKFFALVGKGIYVTDLEAEMGVAAANNLYTANYIMQDYSAIVDSTVVVSEADIKQYYNEHKSMFKQTASRDLEYVVFDLLPSPQDYADAAKYINEIAQEFRVAEAPMQYATLNSQVTPDSRYLSEAQVDGAIAAAVYNNPGAVYGPVLNGDTYTIARLVSTKTLPDSLGAMHILLPATDKNRADSLMTALNNGGDFASLALQFSLDQQANQRGGDLGQFGYYQMIPEFSEACAVQTVGSVFTVTTQFGIHVVKLTSKSAPIKKAQIAVIKYEVEPSAITQQTVYSKASQFMAAAAGSYDNFKKAATESALAKRVARVSNLDRKVSGIEDSRELVRWSFNSKKGDVSQIMELGGDYVVAALTDVREIGIADLSQASSTIRTILVQQKKGEAIAKKMEGSSLSAIASAMGTEVKEIKDLQFSSFYIDGVGVEPKLIGAICGGAKPNTVSKPVVGMTGVYLFDVAGVTVADNATIASEKVKIEAMAQNYLAERVMQAMYETSNVDDMRVKFF